MPENMPEIHEDMIEYIPHLRRYAYSLTRHRHWADDLVQDCLLRALQREKSFKPGTNLRAWLFTIMHNVFIDQVRRASVLEGATSIDDSGMHLSTRAGQEGRIELMELEAALSRLPVHQRATLLLIGLEGLSYEETAEITGVPVGTVKSRLCRARETLRRLTEAPQEGPSVEAQGETQGSRRAKRIVGSRARSCPKRRNDRGDPSGSGVARAV